jgi:hypothetical protein
MEAAMTRRKEAGQALVFAALGLTVLLGFAGLGIDMGMLRYEKRLQQTAADAGALAGANNLAFPASGGVTAGAQGASAQNGYTDGSNNVTVTVNNPPASGPHSGNAKYVEVLVTAVQPTFFMKVLGTNSETITARAVATNVSGVTQGGGCLYTLGPPTASIEGVNITGHATLNATTCGIEDNGNYDPTGGALTVNAGTFGVSGTCSGSGCGKGGATCADQSGPCPALGMPAATNPLSYLTPPCSPCSAGTTFADGDGPGTYTGMSFKGNTNVNFPPGVYVLTGDFTCHGTPTITGTGVMFYFTNGATFNCSGNDTINLTPPSPTNCPACPSQYDGILMYQDPADTNGPTLGGNTGSSFGGVLYFPKSEVTFFGNASNVTAGIVVADAFALSGNPTVNLQGSAGLPPGVSILTNAILVE